MPNPNKGTGAGGEMTNKNGLSYERLTDLGNKITTVKINPEYKIIKFDGNKKKFIKPKCIYKYMDKHIDKTIEKAHGCKKPDECYINKNTKTIFIIEKKFQQRSGSVCEKIQTSDFKLWQFTRTFPKNNIIYIYCLSEWYKHNCKAEIEYLDFKKVPYFWGNDKTYKDNIIQFITSYK